MKAARKRGMGILPMSRMAAPTVRTALIAVLVIGAAILSGCGPKEYREQADKAAYEIVAAAQKAALGKEEPFTIEPASVTLRRQLIEAQDLPYSGAASLGAANLPLIKHWPEKDYPYTAENLADQPRLDGQTLKLTLEDALQIAAKSNRQYQNLKEAVFGAALSLDLERNDFRYLFAASQDVTYIDDPGIGPDVRGLQATSNAQVTKRFKNGAATSLQIGLDLVKLLSQNGAETLGIFADATITVPLLRGSGQHIVTEPLTQAERDVIYAMYQLDRFKRTLAVQVAREYLAVLQRLDQVHNNEANYKGLIVVSRRARRLSEAGRLAQTQVQQASQDELRAQNDLGVAWFNYLRELDGFKITLGLPGDADIELDQADLDRLQGIAGELEEQSLAADDEPATQPGDVVADGAEQVAATSPVEPATQPTGAIDADSIVLVVQGRDPNDPLDMESETAVRIALDRRLDMREALGRVYDAQRGVVVAADTLKPELTFVGTGSASDRRSLATANLPNGELRPELGRYTAGFATDLPLERNAERTLYRLSLILLERAVRDAQAVEDLIKVDVRDNLWTLRATRNTARNKADAVKLNMRRVESQEMLLDAGRAEMRDLLEAREDLLAAQNDASAALVAYRVAQLSLQANLEVLEIDEKGLWREYRPEQEQRD